MAHKFANAKYNCIITGRRAEKLTEVAKELTEGYGIKVLPLVFDVQDKKAVFEAIETLPNEWKAIDVLINNAGLALGRDSFENASLDDWASWTTLSFVITNRLALPCMVCLKCLDFEDSCYPN